MSLQKYFNIIIDGEVSSSKLVDQNAKQTWHPNQKAPSNDYYN